MSSLCKGTIRDNNATCNLLDRSIGHVPTRRTKERESPTNLGRVSPSPKINDCWVRGCPGVALTRVLRLRPNNAFSRLSGGENSSYCLKEASSMESVSAADNDEPSLREGSGEIKKSMTDDCASFALYFALMLVCNDLLLLCCW